MEPMHERERLFVASSIIHTDTNSPPPMQNGTSGEPQCASWDFDLKRMHSVLTINYIAIILLHKTTYLLHRLDNRGMCDGRSEWRHCDLQLQPPHKLCNPCG